MTRKSIGFKIGMVTGLLHLGLFVFSFVAYIKSDSSTAGLAFIPFFVLDAPIQFALLPLPDSLSDFIPPLILFGLFGSLLWFMIPWLMDRLFTRVFPRWSRILRGGLILATIPLFLVGFAFLWDLTITLSLQGERPDELKNSLDSTAASALRQKVVCAGDAFGSITSIDRVNCRADGGTEILLSFHSGGTFLNNRNEKRKRVEFTGRYYQTVKPVYSDDAVSCRFIVHELFKSAALLDPEGKEIWRFPPGDEGQVEGVQCGDIDGDGKPEFAVYHSYRDGIVLLNEKGETVWRYPVYSLGHLEMRDIRGNGKREIIFSNSNNADLSTVFTILDEKGAVADKLTVSTGSSEFEVVRWPGKTDRPNILLTEENHIRIVDMKGGTVIQLDAPGCRTFGEVEAVTVAFRKDEPASLAVRKILHPDLAVLYVYDGAGKLFFQNTEVRKGSVPPALAAVQVDETGNERLWVGHGDGFGGKVVEYSLAQQGHPAVPASEVAILPYAVVYKVAQVIDSEGSSTNGKAFILFKSSLPGVKPKDILLYIDSNTGRIPLNLNVDGSCHLPVSDALIEENPPIISNQPKGSMLLEGHVNPLFSVPENRILTYLEIMRPLRLAMEARTAVGKQDEAQPAESLQALILRVQDHGGSNVLIRAKSGVIEIPGGEYGIYSIPFREQLMKENPDVVLPGRVVWFIGLPRDENPKATQGSTSTDAEPDN